jgi:hypothetical protein
MADDQIDEGAAILGNEEEHGPDRQYIVERRSSEAAGAGLGTESWPPSTSGGDGDDDGVADIGSTDIDILRTVWSNEKAAPEILRFEAELVERVQEQILLMASNLSFLSSFTSLSALEVQTSVQKNGNANLKHEM